MDDLIAIAISETAEEILAVVRSDYKAAKTQRPFAWNMTELKERVERVLWRHWRRPDGYTGPGEKKTVAGL
jgi:hypothetical protein